MGWTTIEYVACGKSCAGCPHGPYRYEWWVDAKGRKHKTYRGKASPAELRELQELNHTPPSAILDSRKATIALALRVLGLSNRPTTQELRNLKRQTLTRLHPDRGGNPDAFARAAAALSYLQAHP